MKKVKEILIDFCHHVEYYYDIEFGDIEKAIEYFEAKESIDISALDKIPNVIDNEAKGKICSCGNDTFYHRHSNWIECTLCNKIYVV